MRLLAIVLILCFIAIPVLAEQVTSVPEKRTGPLMPASRGAFETPAQQNPSPASDISRNQNAMKIDGDINANGRLDFADVTLLNTQLTTLDFNKDGTLNRQDVFYLRQHRSEGKAEFDVNKDGKVNNRDMVALDKIIKTGDVNRDKGISFADVQTLFNNLGGTTAPKAGTNGDINGNGRLDFADVTQLFAAISKYDVNGNGSFEKNDVETLFNTLEKADVSKFDFNGNNRMDFADIVTMNTMLGKLDMTGDGTVNMDDVKSLFSIIGSGTAS